MGGNRPRSHSTPCRIGVAVLHVCRCASRRAELRQDVRGYRCRRRRVTAAVHGASGSRAQPRGHGMPRPRVDVDGSDGAPPAQLANRNHRGAQEGIGGCEEGSSPSWLERGMPVSNPPSLLAAPTPQHIRRRRHLFHCLNAREAAAADVGWGESANPNSMRASDVGVPFVTPTYANLVQTCCS
jgi:hypothetical protein